MRLMIEATPRIGIFISRPDQADLIQQLLRNLYDTKIRDLKSLLEPIRPLDQSHPFREALREVDAQVVVIELMKPYLQAKELLEWLKQTPEAEDTRFVAVVDAVEATKSLKNTDQLGRVVDVGIVTEILQEIHLSVSRVIASNMDFAT